MPLFSSSPRALLSSFVAVLAFASLISAQSLKFSWPPYPEAYTNFTLTWSGGDPPVCWRYAFSELRDITLD
jgi:hypothetical protein